MKIELNRNDYLFEGLKRALKVYIIIILILTVFRIIFTSYFTEGNLITEHFSDLAYAFFMGWKYDSIVASYTLLPFLLGMVLLSLLKSRNLTNSFYFLAGLFYFFIFNFILLISISDLGFYSFFQDHLNILFFGVFEDDTKALIQSIWKNYPVEYALIGYAFIIFLFVFIIKKTFKFIPSRSRSHITPGFFKFNFTLGVLIILLLGGLRGGYGIMVLSPKYSDFSKNLFINQIALNGVITFENAFKLRSQRTSLDFNMAKSLGYGDDIHQVFSDYLGFDTSPTSEDQLLSLIERKTAVNEKLKEKKANVIVILMESFGSHWKQYNEPNFNFLGDLEQYFKEDFYFNNFISSDNGTIGSLMVLGTNIPHRNGARFISESRYMQMPLESASHNPFKDNGYETNFLYGGKLGWRDIGKYFSYQGYHHVEGENHIIDSLGLKDKKGTEWGVYDEHFFDFIKKKLKESKRPQFLIGLSTSNHPPFEVPNNFQAPELVLPERLKKKISREENLFMQRFKAFQYANYQLASFIKWIKNSEFKENTIIAVTGDHNFWGFMNYKLEETYEKYKVPFYLYIPKDMAPKTYNPFKFGSHEDIMTTIYNLSLSDSKYIAFGDDMFSNSDLKSNSLNGAIYASEDGAVFNNKDYTWTKGTTLVNPVPSKEKLETLRRQYRSTLSLADFYLRQILIKSKK